MNVTEFIAKWQKSELKESSAAQQHFLDLCEVVGHEKPASLDPTGESFTFEKGATKHGGGDGWADVWKRGHFGWEYKGRRKDLNAAYDQLLLYKDALENPPLLVVCDMDRIVVHTNFTGTKPVTHDIPLTELGEARNLEIVHNVFHSPDRLKPGATSEAMTAEAAAKIAELAQSLRDRSLEPADVAHFLDRVVFCLFAEDVGLLPELLVTRMLEKTRREPERFARYVGELFTAMADGGDFLLQDIRRFNGNLFEPGPVLDLEPNEIEALYEAARLDWSAIDPSIFGTLFERGLDPSKRAQLGAHYTSREDIETLVEPVVMMPLRREWDETRALVENLLATGKKKPKGGEKPPTGSRLKKAEKESRNLLRRFHQRLASLKVLDPACGSGNFLYVTLQKLKDLEKEVIVFGLEQGFTAFLPLVGPWQLYGIEINRYAYELAQMTVWIGYLQWTRENGFGHPDDPILRPMDTFECKDAILELSDPENPKEPEWPKVDFVVGNPPFLGGKLLRSELGDDYVDQMFSLWDGRVPREGDLCIYWFEKARALIERGSLRRAGLLATQGIRGGANRKVLQRIKKSGDIFFAESDRPWFLDGANVHVSMVGFDEGLEKLHVLDGAEVPKINSNLTSHADVTTAARLSGRAGMVFMGDTKGGAFDIDPAAAGALLQQPNPHGRPNSDVIVPWVNGMDLSRRPRQMCIIDFGTRMPEAEASRYQEPFERIRSDVLPLRKKNKRNSYREYWWRHVESRPAMRAALAALPRFLGTLRVSKFRLFVWMAAPTLPDSQVFAFARSDDYFFGILHSRLHEVWARAQGTQLRERESGFRYTPTTCFETFPFPWPPCEEPSGNPIAQAMSEAARNLNDLRERWLNPPEWTCEEILEFPGSIDGPWQRFVHEPDGHGIGTVRYPRLVPEDDDCAAKLKKRTLTNLYNERPTWLDLAHTRLDEAVFAAYGWPADLGDEEILERLLALNLKRAREERSKDNGD